MKSPYTQPETTQPHQDGEPESVRAVVVERYERCTYCHSKLVFSHDLNLSYLQVIETSRCPGCGVAMHPKKFTLH